MTTETVQDEVIVVDFLDFGQKTPDWRFQNYERLRNKGFTDDKGDKVIFWIGSIDLSQITKNTDHCVIYPGMQTKTPDQYRVRQADGAPAEHCRNINYCIREVKSFLLDAKKKGNKFVLVFLKETVYSNGYHSVSLLHKKTANPKYFYGVPTKKPWYDLPAKEILELEMNRVTINDKVRQVLLLTNETYNWAP